MKHLFLIFLSLLSLASFAEDVTVQKAQQLATDLLQSSVGSRSGIACELVYSGKNAATRAPGVNAPLYVFNNTGGKGFVIVAGDDAAMPILGFSTENNFCVEQMPDNVASWLEGYEREIQYLKKNRIKASPKVAEAWRNASRTTVHWVKRLETADWGQNAPYNEKCPRVGGERTLTGCVMTAMAIKMFYHKFPERAIGEAKGYEYYHEGENRKVEGVKYGHTYNWDVMKPFYWDNESAPEVAQLMFDCGVMMKAYYGTKVTVANMWDVPRYMAKHLQYNCGARVYQKDQYSDAEWTRKLHHEIDVNGPVIYFGQDRLPADENDEVIGHTFLLDGYSKEGYYRVNWGWDGYCNGPYLLSSLEPAEQQNGHPTGDMYNVFHLAVLDLMPNPIEDQLVVAGLSCNETLIKKDVPFKVEVKIRNIGKTLYSSLETAVLLVDKKGKIKSELMNLNAQDFMFYPSLQVKWSPTCVVNEDIEQGDKVMFGYRSSVSQKMEVAEGLDGMTNYLPTQQSKAPSLLDEIAFEYDKKNQLIKLWCPWDIRISIKGDTGKDVSYLIQTDSDKRVVNLASLPDDFTQLIFSFIKGEVTEKITVTLPKKKSIF